MAAMLRSLLCVLAFFAPVLIHGADTSASETKIPFERVEAIFNSRCVDCHGPEKQKGGFRLDLKEAALEGGDSGKAIVPGKSGQSKIVDLITGKDPEEIMPPKGERLSAEEVAAIKRWIDQGAHWPDGPIAKVDKKIDFATQIKPIFQRACYECHGPNKQEGSFRIDTKEAALKGGEVYGNTIKAGDPAKSSFLIIVAGKDPDLPHPEKHKLPEKEIALITKWIEQGANW